MTNFDQFYIEKDETEQAGAGEWAWVYKLFEVSRIAWKRSQNREISRKWDISPESLVKLEKIVKSYKQFMNFEPTQQRLPEMHISPLGHPDIMQSLVGFIDYTICTISLIFSIQFFPTHLSF